MADAEQIEKIEVTLLKELTCGGEVCPPGQKLLLRSDQVARLLDMGEAEIVPESKAKRAVKEV